MLVTPASERLLSPSDVSYFLGLLVVVIRVLNFHRQFETESLISSCSAGLYNRKRLFELL